WQPYYPYRKSNYDWKKEYEGEEIRPKDVWTVRSEDQAQTTAKGKAARKAERKRDRTRGNPRCGKVEPRRIFDDHGTPLADDSDLGEERRSRQRGCSTRNRGDQGKNP